MKNSPQLQPNFTHVDEWIFDLDNTLYSPSSRLFTQIDAKMRSFICELLGVDEDEAYRLQKLYFKEHGTTLSGLMKVHNVKPERFLDHVHDLDVSVIAEDPGLGEAMRRLPGRKIVFTNGTVAHAERVLNRIGIAEHMHEIFDIVQANYHPKPKAEAFDLFLNRFGVHPGRAAMFEDLGRNLLPAHELGMTTVLVRARDGHADPAVRGWGEAVEGVAHIHYHTENLTDFLSTILVRSER